MTKKKVAQAQGEEAIYHDAYRDQYKDQGQGQDQQGAGVDVFLCTVKEEKDIDKQVTEAWGKMLQAGTVTISDISILSPQFIGCSVEEFQLMRRVFAEGAAHSGIYILADDDCVPIGTSFVKMGVETMSLSGYKEYGILSAMPNNANIVQWYPCSDDPGFEHYRTLTDMRVMEHVDVGGIRFIRRGAMPVDLTEWRPLKGRNYDRDHAEQMRERGYRVGYIKALKMHHLGERSKV